MIKLPESIKSWKCSESLSWILDNHYIIEMTVTTKEDLKNTMGLLVRKSRTSLVTIRKKKSRRVSKKNAIKHAYKPLRLLPQSDKKKQVKFNTKLNISIFT